MALLFNVQKTLLKDLRPYSLLSPLLTLAVVWYLCHKYIRRWLNPTKTDWTQADEYDAVLGALSMVAKKLLLTALL